MSKPNVGDLIRIGGEYGTAQTQHVLEGYTIGTEEGLKDGTIPTKSGDYPTDIVSNPVSGRIALSIPGNAYYTDGARIYTDDVNFKAENIAKGKSIFNIAGTYKDTFAAGDYLLATSDIEKNRNNISRWSLAKSIQINRSGAIRVSFDLKSGDGRVYINGVAKGTIRQNPTNNYVTYVQDFSISENDQVQIYLNENEYVYIYVRNFRIYVNDPLYEIKA